jgi:hypothetical protein
MLILIVILMLLQVLLLVFVFVLVLALSVPDASMCWWDCLCGAWCDQNPSNAGFAASLKAYLSALPFATVVAAPTLGEQRASCCSVVQLVWMSSHRRRCCIAVDMSVIAL